MFSNIQTLTRKRKVFISYHHKNDEYYKNEFEQLFGHLFINKSVQDGAINTDVSTDYIKRLIQSSDYLADASVCIVLIGTETWKRKHVDWEISGALNQKLNGYSGLVGILLPTFQLTTDGHYYYKDIPERLANNVKSGYANIYSWEDATSSNARIKEIIETAFENRVNKKSLIDNALLQYVYNKS